MKIYNTQRMKKQNTVYFYIVHRDGRLLGGAVRGKQCKISLLWRPKGFYHMARRFTTAENAQKFIEDYGIQDVFVVSARGFECINGRRLH